MAKYITVSPAYGRDYKSSREALQAFNEEKDFILEDVMDGYAGKPVNKSQLQQAYAPCYVNIRYYGKRRVIQTALSRAL